MLDEDMEGVFATGLIQNRGMKRKIGSNEIMGENCNPANFNDNSCNLNVKEDEEWIELRNAKRRKLLSDLPLDPILVDHLHPSNPAYIKQTKGPARPAKRLYVGNLPPGVSESFLLLYLNRSLQALPNIKTLVPIKQIQLSPEKSYAFMEFENPEDASTALLLDGIRLQSYSLKVRRPTDYQPVDNVTESSNNPLRIKANVVDSPNKIFIGGLPAFMTEDKIISFISAFGHPKSFKLVKDNTTGNSKGYAFFDYLDPAVTDRACLGLNGMKMGDKTLIVKRAIVDKKTNSNSSSSTPNYIDPAILLNSTNTTNTPNNTNAETRVVMLKNMVKIEDLNDATEYEDIVADVTEEAQKYGDDPVVIIPRPPEEGAGTIFIEYRVVTDAVTATRCFSGRKFNGMVVQPSYYSEDMFNRRDFSKV
eukprot:TRINITY_DN4719_c0_g1_i1.p1 TRINITY_DN4719_c0_g1~~TRINITY_DN4719_c0_g1_i1.p1  ORF type:complete len:420 (-),score=72.96 TRINITY_DN4719_c0_g1_i1:155-1414(-)